MVCFDVELIVILLVDSLFVIRVDVVVVGFGVGGVMVVCMLVWVGFDVVVFEEGWCWMVEEFCSIYLVDCYVGLYCGVGVIVVFG